MTLKYETIVNGPFQENCYLVWDDDEKRGIFIDPGDEPERLMRTAQFLGIEVQGIYNTHGHIDHVGGVAIIQERLGIPFALHPDDQFILALLPEQARMFGLSSRRVPKIDRPLADGDTFAVGAHEATVIHTPGHTPGGVSFAIEDLVFVGDTLFAGAIGRTDLSGGSLDQIITAIQTRLLTLEDRVKVLSGHGPSTTIGIERRYNPFLTGRI